MTTPMERFIEQMGLMAQAEGSPRIAGQILGYLLIEGAPRTLAQMAAALKVSKASASTNARLLEYKGAVRRVSPVGQRQDAYEALDEPSAATLRTLAQRFRDNAERIGTIAADFPQSHAAAQERVANYAEFNRKSADFIEEWMDRMATEGCAAAIPEDES